MQAEFYLSLNRLPSGWDSGLAKVKQGGRTIKIADGMIAATALEYDLTLVTRNVKDLAGFGVVIFNPWES